MGEVGIPRREYLYELTFAELLLISRGYENRKRDLWSATRWQTFQLMWCSMADLKGAGIHGPQDLLKLPWDKSESEISESKMPDKAEADRLRNIMRQMNEKNGIK